MTVKVQTQKIFDRMAGVLPYLGLVLIVFLIFQTRSSSEFAEKTLNESIENQKRLRNTLWTNLLLQRSVVLAQGALLTGDPQLHDRAMGIVDSVTNFLPSEPERGEEQNRIVNLIADMQAALEASQNTARKNLRLSPTDPLLRLTNQVEEFGTYLNSFESQEWFALLDRNQHQLESIQQRRFSTDVTYAFFIFFLLVLALVSKQKQRAELFLKQSEKRMRTLAEASYEGLAIVSDGKVTEINPAFEAMFHTQSSSVLGNNLSQFLTYGDGQTLNIASLAANSAASADIVGMRNGTEIFPVEISARQSKMEDQPIQIVAIRDLTHKKETENLRFEKEAAERANRAKSLFLANMSHELRTPMHGILSFSRFGMTGAKAEGNEKLRSFFEEIYQSGSRLMQLLDDLLDLAKLEAGKMSYAMGPVHFADLALRVVNEQEAFASEKNIKIDLGFAENAEMTVIVDSTRISQVIRNMLTNAIKFSDPGTLIKVDAQIANEKLTCQVSNQGSGIPAEEIERVFDKFVQSSKTRNGAGGTGLGLAICKEIIEHHHGKIWAESIPGGRTTFIFEIPLEQPEKKITA